MTFSFNIEMSQTAFTVIHLSWLGSTEINAQHPTVAFDGSFPEFLAEDERITAFLREEAKRRDAS